MKLIVSIKWMGWIGLFAAAFMVMAGATVAGAVRMEVANGDVAGLIAAVHAANDETANSGEDVIVLAANGSYVLMDAYGDPREQTGLPMVTSDIVVQGNNATVARYPWSGMINMFRFFKVGAGGNLTLNDLVLEGGYSTNGGAIYNANYLALNDVTLRTNRAMSGGGALYNYNNSWAELTRATLQGNVTEGSAGGAIFNRLGYVGLFDSTLTDNRAEMGSGGGIYAMRYAQTVIAGSTLDGNQSRFEGGAIHNYNHAFLEVANSTLSGNLSRTCGGAVANTALWPNSIVDHAQTVMTAVTVVNNGADFGGASICVDGDSDDNVSVRLVGSLVASDREVVSQCAGGMFIDADDSSLVTDSTCGNAMFVPYGSLKMGPLAFNGGRTRTHALQPGSMAIDWPFTLGIAGLPPLDQRGLVRPQDGDCNTFTVPDVGAFEHETLIGIDIQPKDAANTVKLNRDQVDVLVVKGGSPWLDVTALTAVDMLGAEIVFGEGRALPTVDLTHPVLLGHHLTADGLLLHFFVAEIGLDVMDQTACLSMHFADGRVFRGCDTVRAAP